MEADFSGYATKAGLKCSDGRTIMPDAFKHQDKTQVPLVWQHGHDDPNNVLGYALLENRPDGVYARGYFNDTPQGKNARLMVQHGDVKNLSIWANRLVEKSKQVFHGAIREVSLVLAGANPGAKIEHVTIQHSDDYVEELDDEAIIWTGLELSHDDLENDSEDEEDQEKTDEVVKHDDETVQDVFESFDEKQKEVVYYMLAKALEHSEDEDDSEKSADENDNNDEDDLTHQEGTVMNVFEQEQDGKKEEGATLSHDDMKAIAADAVRVGSLKQAVENYALAHGIENIETLFPDAKSITNTPEFDKRRTEWVAGVMNGTRKSPFSRVKSIFADITHDEARAKGYIKGNMKKEEFFSVAKRTTGPTTVYKKQKLDRDDVLDITDFDVVAFMKAEMRLMLEEELARAILIGDGREVDDEDKIKDPSGANDGLGIRSIANDHELYAATVNVQFADDWSDVADVVDQILLQRRLYKGTGMPTFYTTEEMLTRLLLAKDNFGRRMYKTVDELASELRVDRVVPVEVMEDQGDLLGIIVNLRDYNIGADSGGEVNFFDDFDIDYNQHKYLFETRVSGALVKIRSALVIRRAASSSTLVEPEEPTFEDNVVTVPTVTGVVYKDASDDTVLTTAAPVTLADGESLTVQAEPDTGYHFASSADDEWTFNYQA